MEKIKDSLGYTVCRVARKIHQRITEAFSQYDMPLGQWVTLKTLAENDGISQKQLSLLLEKDQNNVKAMIDRLEKKHLLRREPDMTDRRAFSLVVTDEGRQMVRKLAALDEQAVHEIEMPLKETERAELLALLARLEQRLDEKKAGR